VEDEEGYDWIVFFLSFVFAAIPTWLIVGGVVWKFAPDLDGSFVLLVATIASIIIGIMAGLGGNGFWSSASKVASFSPYARKNKK